MHPFCVENTSKWHLCLFGLAQPAAKPKNDELFALSITSSFVRRLQRDAACRPHQRTRGRSDLIWLLPGAVVHREDSLLLLLLLLLLLFRLFLRSTFNDVNSPSGPVYNQLLSSASHRHFNLIILTKAT